MMKTDRFDKFLSYWTKKFEKLFGFESWVVLLINHKIKAFFVNPDLKETADNGEESKNSYLEDSLTQRNLSKLLLGVGLTSKWLQNRDYLIFENPEKQSDFAAEVDKIKIKTKLRNLLVVPFYPTPNSTVPTGIIQFANLKSQLKIKKIHVEMAQAVRGLLAGCSLAINTAHIFNLSQL